LTPSMNTRPEVARSRAPMMLSSVDLPLPDGPMMEVSSPRSILKLTPRRAG
jgi:hypothetical protein